MLTKIVENPEASIEIGYWFSSLLHALKSANWRLTRIDRNTVRQSGPRSVPGRTFVFQGFVVRSWKSFTQQASVACQESEEQMEKVNLQQKLNLFDKIGVLKIVGEMNESYVKLEKFKGEFIWHKHEAEDEMFFVVKGRLLVKFRDRDIWIEPSEFLIVPRGVEHLTIAPEEVHLMLIEPKHTLNTGNQENERTQTELEWI